MHWIYILKGGYGIKHYVGETKRLYTRFWEHDRGECANTCDEKMKIVAIYKKDNMGKFFDYNEKIINKNSGFNNPNYLNNWNEIDSGYDHLWVENNIAECMMMSDRHYWKDIHGGKYTRDDCKYKFPENEYIKELPLCHCGLPCDVRKKEENDYLFFRCPKKNFYSDIQEQFEIDDEPCKFFKKYTKDEKSKSIEESSWLENVPSHKDLSDGFPAYCIAYDAINEKKHREENGKDYEDWREYGGVYGSAPKGFCDKYKDRDMKYYNEVRKCLCKECFEKHGLELSKIFTKRLLV